MSQAPVLITTDIDPKELAKIEKKHQARQIVEAIFSLEPGSPKRWRTIEGLWLALKPGLHRYERSAAIAENAEIRRSLLDPKFGRSDATMHGGKMRDVGKNHGKAVQNLRVIGNMPESLRTLLMVFDPKGLGMANGKEGILMKRKLYNEFREYKIPESV